MIRPNAWLVAALLTNAACLPAAAQTPAPARTARSHAASTQAASAHTAAPAFVREMGGIREYRLDNGLQILLFPDDAQSTTTINLTYRVGSRHEGQGEFGMAHLLEHLQFKGTPLHRDIPTEFAQRGMRYNGTTTSDRTNYFASFNANPDTLAWTIGLEADRMRHSFIAKADLDKEMTVVRNEFERGENDPMAVLTQRVLSAAYTWHPYGHTTMGPRSDIENVPIGNLQDFYRRYYRPDNATLLIAGKFDADATLRVVAREFGAVARPAQAIAQPYTVEPAQDGERSVVVRRVGGQPVVMDYYHVPSLAHPDSAALLVYELMLGLQPSGALYTELVESKQAIATGMSGLGGHDPGGVSAVAVVPPDGDVDKVQSRLADIVEGRADAHLDEAQLQRVRDLAIMSYRQQMKNPEALIQQLSDVVAAGDWRLLFRLMDDIPKVTLADVERVRATYFKPANRTSGRYLPASAVERVEIPVAPSLDARLADLKAPPSVEEGERFTPTTQALAARTARQRLPSGIVLKTLAKQTRGNTVVASINLRWASQRETVPMLGTTMAGELLIEGSSSMTRQQMEDRLVHLNASLQAVSGNQEVTLTIRAEKDTLLEAMKLGIDMLRHPTLPAPAFERLRVEHLAAIEATRKDLPTLMNMATRDLVNARRGTRLDDPDYVESVDEALDEFRRTTLADVRKFHDGYWSANDARVVVVGAIPDGVADAVERQLGDWKNPQAPAFEQYVPTYVGLPPARFDVQADDKTSASLSMFQGFRLNHDDPDYQPMLLAVHILGGGSMESRLNTRIRREAGLSYGVGASLSCGFWGDDAGLYVTATFAPPNREKVLAAIRAELAEFARNGPTADELARAKHDLDEGALQARADDGQLAGDMSFHETLGHDWAWVGARDVRLRTVTLAQVRDAWRRLVREDDFVVVTAGDFTVGAVSSK